MQDRRFSHQRERIYQAVRSSHAHPTAEEVYSQLKPEMPRLSLGTVYRNLRQMAAEGRLAEVDGPVARFDACLTPHTHFRCTGCGAVLDLPELALPQSLEAEAQQCSGCHITGCQLTFSGVCPSCQQNHQEELS